MGDPLKVYRYSDSDAALKTLVTGEFRVGKILDFNDPFEWQFGVGESIPEDMQRIEKLRSVFTRGIDSRIGILCFSKVIQDPVLWSLYADKHNGVAFELIHTWSEKDILHIDYSNQRPQIDVRKIHQIAKTNTWDTEFEEYMRPIIDSFIRQKSETWRFEQECRLAIGLQNPNHCCERHGMHFWAIPKNFLTRIILGFRCPLEENNVRKLLDMNGFSETKLVRAKMCNKSYSILC